MATYTPNLNLKKPATTDLVSIADLNGNMDALDMAVAGKQDTIPTTGASQGDVLTFNGTSFEWNSPSGGATIFTNKSASSWVADSTYEDFPYRCAVACTGVTASDVAEVVFNVDDAVSGNYAPVCQTYAGGVYIYSSASDSITIPMILVHKG